MSRRFGFVPDIYLPISSLYHLRRYRYVDRIS